MRLWARKHEDDIPEINQDDYLSPEYQEAYHAAWSEYPAVANRPTFHESVRDLQRMAFIAGAEWYRENRA